MDDDDFDSEPERPTQWAITVDTKNGACIAQQVVKAAEVGEFDEDLGENVRVGALFDKDTIELLEALMLIGGHSLEGKMQICAFLNGVIRSFNEAQANLEQWRAAEGDPDPS